MVKGIVVTFNQSKVYGFIRVKNQQKDIFVHIKNVVTAGGLTKGQNVEFELSSTNKGFSAISVIAGRKQKSPILLFSMVSIILASILSMYFSLHLPSVVSFLIAINITTGVMYAYDKTISSSNLLRIPEKVLHGLAFLGGSPSALIAQKLFRHKTVKHSFQIIYWSIVAIQFLAAIFFSLYLMK
jgi:uncharacterized membrane protein YsdA (DUF1294 family)/cold shock CspA family protein